MYNNTGVMSRTMLYIYIALSVALAILHFTGWMNVPLIAMFIPVGYVIIRQSIFTLLVNSYHFAMHRFEEDMIVRGGEVEQYRMGEAVTLDADSFLRNLRQDDEQAGRA